MVMTPRKRAGIHHGDDEARPAAELLAMPMSKVLFRRIGGEKILQNGFGFSKHLLFDDAATIDDRHGRRLRRPLELELLADILVLCSSLLLSTEK